MAGKRSGKPPKKARKGTRGGSRPSQAALRKRYRAAGWAGVGLLAGLGLGLLVWSLPGQPPAPGAQAVPGSGEGARTAPPAPPREPAGAAGEELAGPVRELLGRGPRAAIIIDDLGNSWADARRVSQVPYPLAMAVLPGTPYAERTARHAHAAGKEVLAHVPMEPGDPAIPLGTRFLRTGMSRERLTAILESNLEGMPYVEGINNHMGSRLTARGRPMRWVMETLRRRGLYFVDSRTTAATRGLKQARAAGVPAAERDVFLDHDPAEAAVRAQFRKLLQEARDRGTAIGIGHPHPVTLKVLKEMLPKASRRGVEIVPLREVVAVRHWLATKESPESLALHGPENGIGEVP